jgi:hypothetical protein
MLTTIPGGAIAKFRRVALARENGKWRLIFVLDSESAQDREEIEDIADEFEALQDHGVAFSVDVTVTSHPLPWLVPCVRVVFRGRESW